MSRVAPTLPSGLTPSAQQPAARDICIVCSDSRPGSPAFGLLYGVRLRCLRSRHLFQQRVKLAVELIELLHKGRSLIRHRQISACKQ